VIYKLFPNNTNNRKTKANSNDEKAIIQQLSHQHSAQNAR